MKNLNVLLAFILFVATTSAAEVNYSGSSFNQVMDVINDRSFDATQSPDANKEMSIYQSGQLPQYPVSFWTLSLGMLKKLKQASKRTISEDVDYYPRLEKMVHSNGVCVAGQWNITAKTKYTGFFSEGSQALFIGRMSVALGGTKNSDRRGFGLAGKLFPTLDENEKVKTLNFFTVEELSGTNTEKFLNVSLTNSPPLIPNLDVIDVLPALAIAFKSADTSVTYRPISHLGVNSEGPSHSPIYLRLSPKEFTQKSNAIDFRDELTEAFRLNNNHLIFNIDVSSSTSDRKSLVGWTRLGTLDLNHIKVSYGCDRQLHFAHPKDDHRHKKD